MSNEPTKMWVVENTHGHPHLKGYDFAFIELFNDNLNTGTVREYRVTGSGAFYLEGHKQPLGTLHMIRDMEAVPDIELFRLLGLTGKKILMVPVNPEVQVTKAASS